MRAMAAFSSAFPSEPDGTIWSLTSAYRALQLLAITFYNIQIVLIKEKKENELHQQEHKEIERSYKSRKESSFTLWRRKRESERAILEGIIAETTVT